MCQACSTHSSHHLFTLVPFHLSIAKRIEATAEERKKYSSPKKARPTSLVSSSPFPGPQRRRRLLRPRPSQSPRRSQLVPRMGPRRNLTTLPPSRGFSPRLPPSSFARGKLARPRSPPRRRPRRRKEESNAKTIRKWQCSLIVIMGYVYEYMCAGAA